MAEAVEKERVVNSKERERLPRIPPPRRRKTRVIWERQREAIRKRVLTAVRKIQILYVCQMSLRAIKPCCQKVTVLF